MEPADFLLRLDAPMHQEQSSIPLLCLRNVSLPTAAWRKAIVIGPVARPAVVVAGVILGHLALAGGATINAWLAPGSNLLLLLLATAWSPTTLLGGTGWSGSFLLLLLLEGAPLLHHVQQLASGSA